MLMCPSVPHPGLPNLKVSGSVSVDVVGEGCGIEGACQAGGLYLLVLGEPYEKVCAKARAAIPSSFLSRSWLSCSYQPPEEARPSASFPLRLPL